MCKCEYGVCGKDCKCKCHASPSEKDKLRQRVADLEEVLRPFALFGKGMKLDKENKVLRVIVRNPKAKQSALIAGAFKSAMEALGVKSEERPLSAWL